LFISPPPQWFCHKLRIEVYDTQAALFPNLPLTRKSLQARVRAADLPRGLCLPLIRRSLHLCAPLLSNLISELRPLGFKLCKALLVSPRCWSVISPPLFLLLTTPNLFL